MSAASPIHAEFSESMSAIMANLDKLTPEQAGEFAAHLASVRELSADPEERAKLELLGKWVADPAFRAAAKSHVFDLTKDPR